MGPAAGAGVALTHWRSNGRAMRELLEGACRRIRLGVHGGLQPQHANNDPERLPRPLVSGTGAGAPLSGPAGEVGAKVQSHKGGASGRKITP